MTDQRLQNKETPHGQLYAPPSTAMQFLILLGACLLGFAMAQGVIWGLGGLSGDAASGIYFAFAMVFILGYSFWTARLRAIALQGIGKGLLKALFLLIVRRQKPASMRDFIPSEEKLLEIAVAAQKAASSFVITGVMVAIVVAPISLFFEAQVATLPRLILVASALTAWSLLLAKLGRRGYLPMAEDGE